MAIAELLVVKIRLLSPFARQLRHARHSLALLLALLHFLEEHFGDVEMAVQEIINLLLDKVAYELIHADAGEEEGLAVLVLVGGHIERAQLNLCLALEHRLDDLHGYRGDESVPDVLHLEVLAAIFLDRAGNMLLERRLMRTALRRVLAVHE